LSEKSPKAIPLSEKPLDDQTGLYNQSFFKNRLETSLKHAKEIDQYLFAVLLFKLEQKHKSKNQAGASTWESVLQEIAGTLRGILRPTDTLARFEADTFYILIENVPDGEILIRIANRIQEILYRKTVDIAKKIQTPIRVGILLCDRGYGNVDAILNDAKYAQVLAVAQGAEYSQYYYQVSARKTEK
jgi:two-component system CheB/CheR fusion protein